MKFIHQPNDKLIDIAKVNSEKKYMSVTKLTGKLSEDAINQWKANVGIEVAEKVMKESSERGTCIHKFCEDYLTNEEILIPEKLIDNYYTFKAMKPELNNINNIIGLEVPLWSDEYKLKGRADCIGEYKGVLSMIDFKTSKKPKKKEWVEPYFIQATAYTEMVKEHTGIDIEQIVLLFGITNYNQCKIMLETPKNYIKELNRINNEFNE
jgi:genome maintenance exonuclease 1|tara:strand:+ start:1988 stop:2614 length:627 start_codon:yes stop_codon:yes gene_type:complete